MNSQEMKDLAAKVIMPTYGRHDLALAKGDGLKLYDPEGKEYLDFVSGLAVVSLGHANEIVADAVNQQARTLVHVSNLYYTEPMIKVAQLLTENSFADRVFYCNSGAEANEAAIKLARKYSHDKYGAGRFRILTMKESFHGRTMFSLAATAQTDKHKGFEPMPEGFAYIPLNDLAALEEALTDDVCAVMIEPIQGEGGVNTSDNEYLSKVAELCRAKDVLLIYDEIQVGMGRTGTLFAYEQYGVEPDIMTLAKALANGLPIGACLAREDVAASFGPGTHASTFGGTPLVCSAALAVLETMLAPGFLDSVVRVGDYFKARLAELKNKFDFIEEIRGRGLILGIKLSFSGGEIVNDLKEKGFLINCIQDSVLRFLPPLTVTEMEVNELIHALEDSLAVAGEKNKGG